MKSIDIRGCATALITPFKNGEVDYEAYTALVKRQIESGMDFLVPLGTTAETPCLEDDEKIEILKITKSLAGDRPVIVGCGTNSLAKTVKTIKLLEPYGPDGYLVVVPYYNKPTQEGLYQYFKAVAESTQKAIVLYNVPSRTGLNMGADITLRLAQIPNVVAIKEASGNLEQITEIINNAPEGFNVLSGNDDQAFEIIHRGGKGLISVASNVAPCKLATMVQTALNGDFEQAKAMNQELMPLYHACFVESNPIPVKAGLHAMGLCQNELRLPLTPSSEETYNLMAGIVPNMK